ncbi:MAG: GNAT family N-acetyltransferase [Saprospiraceae bacterium]|nr:GNAT family N-acetyltransferase [Saprospiraceae bacterium]
MKIRPVERRDLPTLKLILDNTGLFPSSMLEDMIADYFDNPDSTDIWFTFEAEGHPVSLAYCAPERMTNGTYNLYAIAVHTEQQGRGIGTQMMQYIEDLLRQQGHRILIVETSGLADYDRTRTFYRKCQYTQEATIRAFYEEGEDKIIFWKKL